MITKTRSSAKNWSRDAKQLDFDNTRLSRSTVQSRQAIGAPSVDESVVGNMRPSVQAAVEDLAQMMPAKINEIKIFEEGTTPDGHAMIERLVVEGSATDDPLFVYGVPVKVNAGDARAAITQNIYEALQEYQANNLLFKSVSKVSGVDNQLDVEFSDTRPHDNFSITAGLIVITGATIQEAVPGYGVWVKIGEQPITTVGPTPVTTNMVYFKRVS